ncbi:MAG: phenylacetic acid degradation operon negative regulatory protein [Parcubacteria group bacterium Athens0714_16]|nr:MAG: phenylacetic acid degradation operon negative regulatory protein [Parcubacteria group bacterium Athens0714_16]
MKKHNKGELAKNILKTIAGMAFVVGSLALPQLPIVYKMFDAESWKEKEKIRLAIDRLQNKKYIKKYKKDGVDIVEITENGRKEVLKYKLDEIKIKEQKRWDGTWRMIMFDIPEKHKSARDGLTLKLIRMGCAPIQKSVFVTPYECEKEIKFIGEYFGVSKYIIFLETDKISNEDSLRGEFEL